jgi:Protein of unknown function (DUF1064)
MRRESAKEREAWTALVEGRAAKKSPKYGNENRVKEGGYASKHEAEVAANLWALAKAGDIDDLQEQVPFVLVPGKCGVRGIGYIADFVFFEKGKMKVCDAKGYSKNAAYLLKKKLMFLIHGITVEEL